MIAITVDGTVYEVEADDRTLLDVLREDLDKLSVKDGCSPQGQCGCCTVLVDGEPRVSCVTPVRRLRDRQIVTLAGFDPAVRGEWGRAFCETGGSQCGFCTPGIIVRLEALRRRGIAATDRAAVDDALKAHLCRCTGWQTIREAYAAYGGPGISERRVFPVAARRAELEGGSHQRVDPTIPIGSGGFAEDMAPPDALVAVPALAASGEIEWVIGDTLADARARAGKVQGRRSTLGVEYPIEVPEGDWMATLQTTWVEPGYLEPDAAWAEPGGMVMTPLANGGAFGGKEHSPVSEVARRLADEHDRAVRVVYSREDVVRYGPKRPPVAGAVRPDGTGILRVARTLGIAEVVAAVAPGLVVEEVEVSGPPTSVDIRGAGWSDALVLTAPTRDQPGRIELPNGSKAEASYDGSTITVRIDAGQPIDEIVLRSYCIGAAHQAFSWITSEFLRVDANGVPVDLTIRSFGIVGAAAMPEVDVEIVRGVYESTNGSEAVFAAVASAVWVHAGTPRRLPIGLQD